MKNLGLLFLKGRHKYFYEQAINTDTRYFSIDIVRFGRGLYCWLFKSPHGVIYGRFIEGYYIDLWKSY